jgi:hypothetical protein
MLGVAACDWSLTQTNITTACYLAIASQLYATFFHKFAFDATMTSTLGKVDEAVDTTTERGGTPVFSPGGQRSGSPEGPGQKNAFGPTQNRKGVDPSCHPRHGGPTRSSSQRETAHKNASPTTSSASSVATSSATFPGEGHGEDWHPQDPYGQDPQYKKSWSDQWRSDSYMHPTQQDFRLWEGHMPLPYGHHPSSPYTSCASQRAA